MPGVSLSAGAIPLRNLMGIFLSKRPPTPSLFYRLVGDNVFPGKRLSWAGLDRISDVLLPSSCLTCPPPMTVTRRGIRPEGLSCQRLPPPIE